MSGPARGAIPGKWYCGTPYMCMCENMDVPTTGEDECDSGDCDGWGC